MSDSPPEQVMCATYTHARRHPLVLGHIAGWTPPFQVSLPQLGVVVVTFLVEMVTWRFWGALLPKSLALVIAIGLPWALAWAVRRARVEGRSLLRAAAGYLMLLSAPPGGKVGGRPYSEGRKADLRSARVFLMADDK
jgi:TcpE family